MSLADQAADEGTPSRKREYSRLLLKLFIALGIPTAVFVLVAMYVVVLPLYVVLFFEGLVVEVLLISRIKLLGGTPIVALRNNNRTLDLGYEGWSRAESFAYSVRTAAKGDHFSRQDVAKTLRNTLDQYTGSLSASDDTELARDLEVVLYPYEQDTGQPRIGTAIFESTKATTEPLRGFSSPVGKSHKNKSPPLRGKDYLSSLERTLSRLEELVK